MLVPKVDKEKCIGCGACIAVCPEVFELRNGKSFVKNPKGCSKCDCKAAADSCSVQAVTLVEKK